MADVTAELAAGLAAAGVVAGNVAVSAAADGTTVTPVAVTPGVSICHMVTPLYGAGSSICFMTNDFAQLLKSKIASWPTVQVLNRETLQTREARYIVGGMLASVLGIVLWKFYKRYKIPKAKDKRPLRQESRTEEAMHWHREGGSKQRTPGNDPRRQCCGLRKRPI